MKTMQRGRVSAAAQSVALVESLPRPDAPYDLTDAETDEWRAIVNRMPAESFPRETHALLAQYCRHIVNSHHIAQLKAELLKGTTLDMEQYQALLGLEANQSRMIAMLSTKMRVAPQSTYDRQHKTPVTMTRPWEV